MIGIDEIAIRTGRTYRIVVSDLLRGGRSGSAARTVRRKAWMCSMQGSALTKSARIRLAVMDMWKPFRKATVKNAPQAAILFDKFHVIRHLGVALDRCGRANTAAYRA